VVDRMGLNASILEYRKQLEEYVYEYLKNYRNNADVMVISLSIRELEDYKKEIKKVLESK
jgi:hypothetical protein